VLQSAFSQNIVVRIIFATFFVAQVFWKKKLLTIFKKSEKFSSDIIWNQN